MSGFGDDVVRAVASSLEFRASAAPYLVLDNDLRIVTANVAYQRATHHDLVDMEGEFMFDVFPDNPATPEARSVERLAASFERALLSGEPHRMDLQRYDVVDGENGFVRKSWLPVNTPIRDADGTTLGVLHHVEDVTRLVLTTALERDLLAPRPPDLDDATTSADGPFLALRRDSLERRTRARTLIDDSREAIGRMSRRIRAGSE